MRQTKNAPVPAWQSSLPDSRAWMGICLLAGFMTMSGWMSAWAQSSSTGAGSGSGSGGQGSGQGSSQGSQGSTASGTPGSGAGSGAPGSLGPAGWAETGPAAPSDTSATGSSGQGGAGGGGSNPILADYVAPLSKMHWGPFSVLGWDAFGSWSNQPLGLNGNSIGPSNLEAVNGIATPTSTIGYHIATSMGAHWRWGKGFIGLQYAPSIDYQTATGVRQINWQNVSLVMDHPFQFGKWRLSLAVRSAAVTSYSEAYNPPSLTPLGSVPEPISNNDLVGLLNKPQPVQPPTTSQLFLATRFYTGSAIMTLARTINARDSLTFSITASMNHTLNFGQQTGALFNYPQSSGGSAVLSYGHVLSHRSQVSLSFTQAQAFGGGIGVNAGQEQALQLTYSWAPWRKLSFQAGGGPARTYYPGTGGSFTYAGTATVSFIPFSGSAITVGYSRSFDPNGFAGGQQADRLNLVWSAPQPRGHKWRYALTTNYVLGQSLASQNGQPGQYATGSGITVSASWSYPVTRALMFTSNYAYLFQNVTNVQNSTTNFPATFQRHLVSVGFHYSFGVQGAGGSGGGEGSSGGMTSGDFNSVGAIPGRPD